MGLAAAGACVPFEHKVPPLHRSSLCDDLFRSGRQRVGWVKQPRSSQDRTLEPGATRVSLPFVEIRVSHLSQKTRKMGHPTFLVVRSFHDAVRCFSVHRTDANSSAHVSQNRRDMGHPLASGTRQHGAPACMGHPPASGLHVCLLRGIFLALVGAVGAEYLGVFIGHVFQECGEGVAAVLA